MVAEDRKGVGSDCARRNMEHAGKQLARDLVHIRNHQQQTLRSGVCACQRAGLKRAVNCAGRTGLTLHFLHQDCLAEDVFSACRAPVVDIFGHCRRGSDGIDGGYLTEHVAHMGCSLIAITGQKFFLFTHK